jgi:hypothetical protein
MNTATVEIPKLYSVSSVSPRPLLSLHQYDVQFDLTMNYQDIKMFRERILATFSKHDPDNLLSNEIYDEEGKHTLNRYPLIRYLLNNRRAQLIGLNKGADLLYQLNELNTWPFVPTGTNRNFFTVALLPPGQMQRYCLYYYIGLRGPLYKQWHEDAWMPEIQKLGILEYALKTDLVHSLQQLGGQVQEEEIQVSILSKQSEYRKAYQGRYYTVFNLVYATNLWLPDRFSLGKLKSHGYGWQRGWEE